MTGKLNNEWYSTVMKRKKATKSTKNTHAVSTK